MNGYVFLSFLEPWAACGCHVLVPFCGLLPSLPSFPPCCTSLLYGSMDIALVCFMLPQVVHTGVQVVPRRAPLWSFSHFGA